MERNILFIHILGAIIFLGNIVVTFFWKWMANRSNESSVLIWSQSMVTKTDRVFTTVGAGLLAISGYSYAASLKLSVTEPWLLAAQAAFYGSAIIWAVILLPIQHKQYKLLADLTTESEVPSQYWRLARKWNTFGTLATILPIVALYLMVTKPMMG